MSRPRLSLKAATSPVTLWLGLVLVVLMAVFGYGASQTLGEAALLARDGIETSAVAIDRARDRHRSGTGRIRITYAIVLRYEDQTGAPHFARQPTSSSEYDNFEPGEVVALRYSASRPEIWELSDGGTQRTAWGALTGATIFGVLAAASLGAYARGLFRQHRAGRKGQPIVAEVTDIRRYGRRKGGKRPPRAEMAWIGHAYGGGATGLIAGRTRPLPRADLPPEGSEITVWIDPKSGRGYWEGEF